MKISSRVISSKQQHEASVQTNGAAKKISIPPKDTGYGSSVNGGELLCLALATCYCNDLYREAAKLNISVSSIDVECTAFFEAEGEPGEGFEYHVRVESTVDKSAIRDLIEHTDKVAEIHNTLRKGATVKLAF